MNIDDLLRVLRLGLKINMTIRLDTDGAKWRAVCDQCGKTIGEYATQESMQRALRSHLNNCPVEMKKYEHLFTEDE